VFQRRVDGSVDFYRDWKSYKRGFGSRLSEFWLGNDNIHLLISLGTNELRVDLRDFDKYQFATFGSFKITGETEKYKLILGLFVNGTAVRIYHSSQFSIIRKFAESAIHTILQIIYEDIEQNRPQDRPLGHST
ncbi:unnamed protein product, partial [Natator depressus]